jgi:hypothetical protein
MNRLIYTLLTLSIISYLFCGCGGYSLETAKMRESDYNVSKITLTQNGLTQAEINTISHTKYPKEFPVDVSILIMKDYYVDNSMEQIFLKNIVDSLRTSKKIDRIIPIPRFLIPNEISFPKIQELGIRSLSEYTAVFNINAETFFHIEEIVNSKVEITSTIDFILIDSKTTAIVASDRLYSSIIYDGQVFKNTNKRKAQEEIFAEQGKEFSKIISNVFKK